MDEPEHPGIDASTDTQHLINARRLSLSTVNVPQLKACAVPYYNPDKDALLPNRPEPNLQKSASFTPDGQCIITNSGDNRLRTFVLPVNLLEDGPHALSPYSVTSSPESINAFTIYPHWNTADPSTTYVLSSMRHQPMRLTNALDGTPLSCYSLINEYTEEYRRVSCLQFISGGTHFVAGSRNLIAVFDVSRYGQPPVTSYVTAPSKSTRRRFKSPINIAGEFSTFALDNSDMLAAGTFNRHIAIFANGGRGEFVTNFSLANENDNSSTSSNGITGLKWSPCGRYLYIAERKSDGIAVYDIRGTGMRLSWLAGREANTNQRLDFDILPKAEGHDVIAGGADGRVRIWKNPSSTAGVVVPTDEWQAHDEAVASTIVHPSVTSVVATTSGERHFTVGASDSESSEDASESDEEESGSATLEADDKWMKVWQI